MEAKLSIPHPLCGSLSHHESEISSKKSLLLNEGPNEVANKQFHQNIDTFQIMPDKKLSSLHGLYTTFSKLEKKSFLEEKQLVYSGIAGDLISPSLNQHMVCKLKCYSSNEYLSESTQQSFNKVLNYEKTHLKASPISKLQRKIRLSEDKQNSLIFTVTNSHGLKKQTAVQKASHFEDQVGNSNGVMRDEPGIDERVVPEFYVNIKNNKANYSLTQKNISNSIDEVCEAYSYSPECREKWKNIQRFRREQHLIYHGSAGDLISFIHGPNTNILKGTKNVLESLSQPRASCNEDFIHEVNYDSNVCTAERMVLPKTAKTINDKVKVAVKHGIPEINHFYDKCSARNDIAGSKEIPMQHINTGLVEIKSIDSQIQSEKCKVISKVSNIKNSVAFAAEYSSARNWKWKEVEKYIKGQEDTRSGFASEIIPSTSRLCVHTSQMSQATSSLSDSTEYIGNKLIKEAISRQKSNFKVSTDLLCFISFHSSKYNAMTEYEEVMLSNMNTTPETMDTASSKYPQINKFTENSDVALQANDEPTETTISKDVHTNVMQSYDMLSIYKKYPLINTNSCKFLQEQSDQIVPNKVQADDYESDEFPCIMHNTDSSHDASNNSECRSMSPDVFGDKDDISLYGDSPRNSLADNTYLNTSIKETAQNTLNPEDKSKQNVTEFHNTSHVYNVNDTSIYKLSQNIPKHLKTKENDDTDCFISRVEKRADLVSFEDESLTEDVDCLYASDRLPICLTQPAIPTYLLRNNISESLDSNSKGLEIDTKFLERCPDQCFKEKTERTIDNTNIKSFYENENIYEDSCESTTTSKIILCTTPSPSALLCNQNSAVLTSDKNNSEASKQKMIFSVSSNCDAKFEENINIQTAPQNDKLQLKNQLHKTNIYKTDLKEKNAKNGQSYNKNIHRNADEICNTHFHLSPTLENQHEAVLRSLSDCMSAASNDKYWQAQGIENLPVSKGDVCFIEKSLKALDSCITSAALQKAPILKKQKHAKKRDGNHVINTPTSDTQSNQVIPVNNISKSENCMNVAQKHSNNHPGLTQHSSSNEIYLDISENSGNEYSSGPVKLAKSQATFKDMKEEDHQENDKCTHPSSEEYDSDASITEVTSESSIDIHINSAIEKYQNVSSGSEKTCIQGRQNKVNSMEVAIQTDIFGLAQMEKCICKKFQLCCELCNENLPEVSQNKAEKRQAISSYSEMPMNKKAKCYNQKTEIMNCSNNAETESKMQALENIKCVEDIKTLSQVYFNKCIASPEAVLNDNLNNNNNNNHHDDQDVYQYTQLFNWCNAEKSETLPRFQEVNEQEIQQNLKPRASLRIGLSKRAKTKPLHYSSN